MVVAAALAVDLRGSLAGPGPAPVAAPTRVDGPAATPPPVHVEAPPPPAPARIRHRNAVAPTPTGTTKPAAPRKVRVPALGIDADVLDVGLDAEGRLEVPPAATTVGWWSGGPGPSEEGPTVLVGHVDWRGELGVFHDLSRLEADAVIEIVDEEGRTSRFAVDGIEQHAKSAFPTEAVYGKTSGPSLRLVTCAGPFDRAAGHYTDNLIVFAGPIPTGDRS